MKGSGVSFIEHEGATKHEVSIVVVWQQILGLPFPCNHRIIEHEGATVRLEFPRNMNWITFLILGTKTKQAGKSHVINEIMLSLSGPMDGIFTSLVVVRGIELT